MVTYMTTNDANVARRTLENMACDVQTILSNGIRDYSPRLSEQFSESLHKGFTAEDFHLFGKLSADIVHIPRSLQSGVSKA